MARQDNPFGGRKVGSVLPFDRPGFVSGPQSTPGQTGLPEDFGQRAPKFIVRVFALDTLTENKKVQFGSSSFIWAIDASTPIAEVTFKFNRQDNGGVPFRKGTRISGFTFDDAFISHSAQAGDTITIVSMLETERELQITNAGGAVEVISPPVFSAPAPVSVVVATPIDLLAANPKRVFGIISNPSFNAWPIYVQDAFIGGNGIYLPPGGPPLFLATTALIRGVAVGAVGGTSEIPVSETTR